MKKTYKINEIFYSLQGEGIRSGSASIFIRFAGCNLQCPFCDTQHQEGEFLSLEQIYDKIKQYPCRWIVLTGGEPTLFADQEFIDYFHDKLYNIAIETNGTKEIPYTVECVTLSPKFEFAKNAAVKLTRFDELKVVFDNENDMNQYNQFFCSHKFVQPCDTGDKEKNAEILSRCINFILKNPSWRLSLQTQKIINVR